MRSVPIPEVIISIILWHLACFAEQGNEGLVFTSPCREATTAHQLPAIHFHDLRHTGNTLAASAGASHRELMERMGHDSERAALVYLHSSEERQHQIADTLSKLATEELKRAASARVASPPPGDRARHGHETGNKPLEDRPQEPGNRV